MAEVERFDAYYGYPSCRATGRHIHANGEFVLASDYDALAADLEAVKAERDALAKRINHDGTPVDIAALCAEIDEVTDELAHVKAESLRVVRVGDPCEISKISICACFLHLGVLYRLYSFSHEELGAWQISDHTEHLFSPGTIVQRVRLERWENSNE